MTVAREVRCPEPRAYPLLLALSCPAFRTCEASRGEAWIEESSRDALRVEALSLLYAPGHQCSAEGAERKASKSCVAAS